MLTLQELTQNYREVEERIGEAAARSDRSARDVTLLPVTKTMDVSVLQMAYDIGMRRAGENHVQEILAKKPALPSDLDFHMIGHLQKNKVKQVLGQVSLIHSVDSLELASAIEKEAAKRNLTAEILIQINAAAEETKFGVSPGEARDLILRISEFPNVRVRGLMTVAPFVEDPEQNRGVFFAMHKIFVDIRDEKINNVNMSVLSMGMTNDYEVAIEEGATLVRVGTGIFGARHYNR